MLPNSHVTDFLGRRTHALLHTPEKEPTTDQIPKYRSHERLIWRTTAFFFSITNRTIGEGSLIRIVGNSKAAALLETLRRMGDGYQSQQPWGCPHSLQAAPPPDCVFFPSLSALHPHTQQLFTPAALLEGTSRIFQSPRAHDPLSTPGQAGGFLHIPKANVPVGRACHNLVRYVALSYVNLLLCLVGIE